MHTNKLFHMEVRSHHFLINKIEARIRPLILDFARRFIQWKWARNAGVNRRTPDKIFAASRDDRSEFRFHKNALIGFIQFLENNRITPNLYQRVDKVINKGALVPFKMKEGKIPRDYQIPIIEYLNQETPISKLVGIQTGKGKTLSSLFGVECIGQRLLIVIKPGYIDKWIPDILGALEIQPDRIAVVQGGKSLMTLMSKIKDKSFDADVIIVSNKTMQNYLTAYERFGEGVLDIGYDLLPDQFFDQGQFGIRLIDEVHLDFHLCFKIDLYTHIANSISLSATLLTQDPFMAEMYKLMFPISERFPDIPLDKYIDSFAVHYQLEFPDKVRTMEYGGTNYSHNAFESSVMKMPKAFNNYLTLIDEILSCSYLLVKREKKKCLIFAYTKEMCSAITEYILKKYPDFDTRRYVSGDPYDNIMQAEICVSTLGSAGTALDIPDLTTVILTTGINSIKSNVQSLGRLRQLADGHPVQFYYFVCDDVPKHIDYHNEKKIMLQERAKSFKSLSARTKV